MIAALMLRHRPAPTVFLSIHSWSLSLRLTVPFCLAAAPEEEVEIDDSRTSSHDIACGECQLVERGHARGVSARRNFCRVAFAKRTEARTTTARLLRSTLACQMLLSNLDHIQ